MKEFGAAGKHGDAHRLFIGGALIDEAVFAKGEAVVAHVNDERGIEFAARCEFIEDAAEALIHGHQSLAVTLVVFGDI